jgi:hypothetical protein
MSKLPLEELYGFEHLKELCFNLDLSVMREVLEQLKASLYLRLSDNDGGTFNVWDPSLEDGYKLTPIY